MTLSPAERDARATYLTRNPHCAYCMRRSTTINYLHDHSSVPCCGACLRFLINVPQSWTFQERSHYIDSMLAVEDRRHKFATISHLMDLGTTFDLAFLLALTYPSKYS